MTFRPTIVWRRPDRERPEEALRRMLESCPTPERLMGLVQTLDLSALREREAEPRA